MCRTSSLTGCVVSYSRGPVICGSLRLPRPPLLACSTPLLVSSCFHLLFHAQGLFPGMCDDSGTFVMTRLWTPEWPSQADGECLGFSRAWDLPRFPLQTGSRKPGWQSRTGSRNGSHHRYPLGNPLSPLKGTLS